MKKILFTLKVFALVGAFPFYFLAEVNHGTVKPVEKQTPAIQDAQALKNGKERLVVILNMPPAPESFVQD